MTNESRVESMKYEQRYVAVAKRGDEDLGALTNLPGIWEGKGRGWNMIALPSAPPAGSFLNYRLLLNQYDETLKFTTIDKGVPNRGVNADQSADTDQLVVTLDYEQTIHQIAVADRPDSGKAGNPGAAIHHEPGLFLNMLNFTTNDLNIARLASIPHGDSALALGRSSEITGGPQIPAINGLPIGVSQDLGDPADPANNGSPYLEPYRHFHENPFVGTVTFPGFQGFDPVEPHLLLTAANEGVNIVKTTILELDTSNESGGIHNIPFIVKQANAASMKSTFWIQELDEKDENGDPKLRLQYSQVVMLDFFDRRDGLPGVIRWPHVSINTLEKISDIPENY